MQDIKLSNGTVITHRDLGDSCTEVSIVGTEREMTSAEWNEYCDKLTVQRARDAKAAKKAQHTASINAFNSRAR